MENDMIIKLKKRTPEEKDEYFLQKYAEWIIETKELRKSVSKLLIDNANLKICNGRLIVATDCLLKSMDTPGDCTLEQGARLLAEEALEII